MKTFFSSSVPFSKNDDRDIASLPLLFGCCCCCLSVLLIKYTLIAPPSVYLFVCLLCFLKMRLNFTNKVCPPACLPRQTKLFLLPFVNSSLYQVHELHGNLKNNNNRRYNNNNNLIHTMAMVDGEKKSIASKQASKSDSKSTNIAVAVKAKISEEILFFPSFSLSLSIRFRSSEIERALE